MQGFGAHTRCSEYPQFCGSNQRENRLVTLVAHTSQSLCEVHLWSEHLVVTAGWPFVVQGCHTPLVTPGTPPPLKISKGNPPFILFWCRNKRQRGWTSHRSCPSTASTFWKETMQKLEAKEKKNGLFSCDKILSHFGHMSCQLEPQKCLFAFVFRYKPTLQSFQNPKTTTKKELQIKTSVSVSVFLYFFSQEETVIGVHRHIFNSTEDSKWREKQFARRKHWRI